MNQTPPKHDEPPNTMSHSTHHAASTLVLPTGFEPKFVLFRYLHFYVLTWENAYHSFPPFHLVYHSFVYRVHILLSLERADTRS